MLQGKQMKRLGAMAGWAQIIWISLHYFYKVGKQDKEGVVSLADSASRMQNIKHMSHIPLSGVMELGNVNLDSA